MKISDRHVSTVLRSAGFQRSGQRLYKKERGHLATHYRPTRGFQLDRCEDVILVRWISGSGRNDPMASDWQEVLPRLAEVLRQAGLAVDYSDLSHILRVWMA